MKLDQFVTQTLVSIMTGIQMANKEAFEKKLYEYEKGAFEIANYGEKMDNAKYINFDVAVAVSSQVAGDVKGGGDILVASLNSSLEAKQNQENISRVSFKIYCHCERGQV